MMLYATFVYFLLFNFFSISSIFSTFFFQIGTVLSKLWPLLTGTPELPTTAPSLKDFAHLAPVLEQLVTGKADKETWDK